MHSPIRPILYPLCLYYKLALLRPHLTSSGTANATEARGLGRADTVEYNRHGSGGRGDGRWYTSVCCNENDSRSSETVLTINLMTGVFVVLELAICSSSAVSCELVERN